MNNFCFNQDQGMVHPLFISFEFLVTHHFFDVLVSLLLLLTEKGPWALSASVDGPGTSTNLKRLCVSTSIIHILQLLSSAPATRHDSDTACLDPTGLKFQTGNFKAILVFLISNFVVSSKSNTF